MLLHEDITDEIIAAFYTVYNELGFGFLERVYQNALYYEMRSLGLNCEPQKAIDVYYKGKKVGDYIADFVVENKVIVELKAVKELKEEHECQLLNYLTATSVEVGLLLNFGPRPEVRRLIMTNDRKK